MACIEDDSTLTPISQKVLFSLRSPGGETEIAELTGLPMYRVRSSLRELVGAGFLVQSGDRYKITEAGLDWISDLAN